MRCVYVVEERFEATPDGSVWAVIGPGAYQFWQRYLDVFEEVVVVARVLPVSQPSGPANRADGPGVSFLRLPHYVGPLGFLRTSAQRRRVLQDGIRPDDALVLRVPSPIAGEVASILSRRRQPFGIQAAGDPADVFRAGASRHPLRIILRWWFTRAMRGQAASAAAALYCTASALQRGYPSRHMFSASDVEVECIPAARSISASATTRLVTVGSLEQPYKGHDTLIQALAICRKAGANMTLRIVGDGRYRPNLERLASAEGVADAVRFAGQLLPGEAVRAEMDSADLFVLPSRSEGLPRALVEAMARALPCIASDVGGIPELLPSSDLVPPSDPGSLAERILSVAADPQRLEQMSHRNLQRARQFLPEHMRSARLEFLRHLRSTISHSRGAA